MTIVMNILCEVMLHFGDKRFDKIAMTVSMWAVLKDVLEIGADRVQQLSMWTSEHTFPQEICAC